MKQLIQIINEEGDCAANGGQTSTPGNTLGAGNPYIGDDGTASEPINPPATKQEPRKKKKKKLLEYIDEQLVQNIKFDIEENPYYTKSKKKIKQGTNVELDNNEITVE